MQSGGSVAHTAGIFSDMTVDGPEIGTLVVVLDRAKNLPNRKTIGKQDPYCAVRLAKEAKKTPTDRRGGQTPRWDSEVRFNVHDSPDYYKLKVSCFSEDKKTELIGETFLNLEDIIIPGGGKGDQWYELRCRDKYAGEIRIELTYYDTRPPPEKPVAVEKKRETTKRSHDSPAAVAGPRQPSSISRRPLPENPTKPVSIEQLNERYDPALQSASYEQLGPQIQAGASQSRSNRSSPVKSNPIPRNGSFPDQSGQLYDRGYVSSSYQNRSRLSDGHRQSYQPYSQEFDDVHRSPPSAYGPPDIFPPLEAQIEPPPLLHNYSLPVDPMPDQYDQPPPPPRHSVSHGSRPSDQGYPDNSLHYHTPPRGSELPSYNHTPSQLRHSDYPGHQPGPIHDQRMQLYDSNHVSYDEEPVLDPDSDMPSLSYMVSPEDLAGPGPPPPPFHQAHTYSAPVLYQPTPQNGFRHSASGPTIDRYQSESQTVPPSLRDPSPLRSSAGLDRSYGSSQVHGQPRPALQQQRPRGSTDALRSSPTKGSQSWQPSYYDASYTPPPQNRRQSQIAAPTERHSHPNTPSSLPNSHRNSYQTTSLRRDRSPQDEIYTPDTVVNQQHPSTNPSPLNPRQPVRHSLPHQATQTVKRKSVSPHPPPSASGSSSFTGVPFGPDSFDQINPTAAASASTVSTRSAASYKAPIEAQQAADRSKRSGPLPTAIDENTPIYGSDGRVIDPSDHLPSETWAPEPERKNSGDALKNGTLGARASPRGAQPMPGGKKGAGASMSAAATSGSARPASIGGPTTIHTTNPSPYSTSANKLHKRNPNSSSAVAMGIGPGGRPQISPAHSSPAVIAGSSPLARGAAAAPAQGEYPDIPRPPRFSQQALAQGQSHRASYQGQTVRAESQGGGYAGYSYSSAPGVGDPYAGHGPRGGGNRVLPPPLPAKVPLEIEGRQAGYERYGNGARGRAGDAYGNEDGNGNGNGYGGEMQMQVHGLNMNDRFERMDVGGREERRGRRGY